MPRQPDPEPFVSTGALPAAADVEAWVQEAWERFRDEQAGTVSAVYPALERVEPELFGICVAGTNGRLVEAGDTTHPFTIMSVSKPFAFALVCERLGPDEARRRLGANGTGRAFDSVAAVEAGRGVTNPMVNPGAIATTSLIDGAGDAERWQLLHDGLSRFAGRELQLDEEVLASARATNHRNRAIGRLLHSYDRLGCDPDEAVDRYTRQCALRVTARDLAVMGATLADGGVNPVTGDRVVSAEVCHHVLAVMLTAGMYETSGDWLYDVGLPAKSGIGGGIVTVSPGKGGLGTFAPRLDAAGNSVRGGLAARFLSRRLGLDLLLSAPHAQPER